MNPITQESLDLMKGVLAKPDYALAKTDFIRQALSDR